MSEYLRTLQRDNIPIEMVYEALRSPNHLVQANALIGLGKRLRNFPEFRTNDWIDKLDVIINSPTAWREIFGNIICVYHLCLWCIYEIGTEEANAYFHSHYDNLDDFDKNNLNRNIAEFRKM